MYTELTPSAVDRVGRGPNDRDGERAQVEFRQRQHQRVGAGSALVAVALQTGAGQRAVGEELGGHSRGRSRRRDLGAANQ